ncbi:MAG: tetratricopeptide repeat protein [Cyanobacteria bacterium J06600_6]
MSELDSVEIEQTKQAIAKCLEQIKVNPNSANLYTDLGDLYRQQQQWQLAIKNYRQAIKIEPDLAGVHHRLATVLEKNGNQNLASNHLYEALQLQPQAFGAEQRYQLGQTLASQKKPAKAIACYRLAIESQPTFDLAYWSLAELLLQQNKSERAVEVYRQGVKYNPENPDFTFALASALAAQQKWVRACNNFQRTAELKPSGKVYAQWGIAKYELGEYPEAQRHLQQAVKLEPTAEIYYYLGLIELELEQPEGAIASWKQAIALRQDYFLAYYQLGLLWQNQQQWQEALAAYRQVIALRADFIPVLVNLGLVQRQLEQFDLAISCYRQAIERLEPGSTLEAHAFAGYQQTLESHPQITAILYYQYGKLLRARGRFPRAIAGFSQALKLDPYFKNTYIDLQYTPIDNSQFPQLIEVYRQIVREHPEITIAWGNLGDALTQQDRVAEAIECYQTGSYQQAIQTNPDLASLDWSKPKKRGPDFIIAGASKSGTSSIYYYLSRHPQILLSHKKELDFYWQHYSRGVDWYLAHFPSITDRPDFLTGEATPNYLRFPQVAQRIKTTFPQTKIIILLRNPVDRAISWHYHKVNSGLTKLDLPTAIATEIERLATVTEAEIINTGFYNPDNIMSSLYIYKIKPWIETLGRDQFLILKSEDFYLNPQNNMAKVFEFLNLPVNELEKYPTVNAGSYRPTDPEIRATLANYFAPYNKQLESYLGMEFNWE